MMTKEDVTELFANIAENAPWDLSQPLLWGYYFTNPTSEPLEQAATLLALQGYRPVELYQPELDEPPPPCGCCTWKRPKCTASTACTRAMAN